MSCYRFLVAAMLLPTLVMPAFMEAPVELEQPEPEPSVEEGKPFDVEEIISKSFDALWASDDWKSGGLSGPDEEGNSLMFMGESMDEAGGEHKRVQQYFMGLPIWGADMIQHVKPDGSDSFTGNWFDDLMEVLGEVTAADFMDGDTMLQQLQADTLALYPGQSQGDVRFSDLHHEAMVYRDEDNTTNATSIAYYIHFFIESKSTGEPKRPHYIINATDLSIIKQWEGLTDGTAQAIGKGPGGNEEAGQHYYGKDFSKLSVTRDGDTCIMETDFVKTINMAGSTSDNITDAFSFTCPNHSSDAVNGAYSPLNDAHHFGKVIFDMYDEWFGISPLTTQLIMRVHYGSEYENAFWNGETMTFGDGKDYFYPLVSLDVVAHEVSHGFTEQNSKLVYRGQSGGINEAFSDMAAKAAEFFLYGSVKNWGIGQDITKDDKPLRYMNDPPADTYSIAIADDFAADMDVHYSSGVFNKAFHTIATSSGWDVKKAFKLFVCANRNYWTSTSTFLQAANGVLSCAEDLSLDVSAVKSALKEVGLTLGGADSTEEMCSCPCEQSSAGRQGQGGGSGAAPSAGQGATTEDDCFAVSNSSNAEETISYFDDDGDGKISKSENAKMATSCEKDLPGCEQFQTIWFEVVDANDDGFVTTNEIIKGEAKWDINNDGLVCDSETPQDLDNYDEYQSVYRRY